MNDGSKSKEFLRIKSNVGNTADTDSFRRFKIYIKVHHRFIVFVF